MNFFQQPFTFEKSEAKDRKKVSHFFFPIWENPPRNIQKFLNFRHFWIMPTHFPLDHIQILYLKLRTFWRKLKPLDPWVGLSLRVGLMKCKISLTLSLLGLRWAWQKCIFALKGAKLKWVNLLLRIGSEKWFISQTFCKDWEPWIFKNPKLIFWNFCVVFSTPLIICPKFLLNSKS